MKDFDAIGIVEGWIEFESDNQVIEAWQHLIDTGLTWSLQGWYGKTALQLIKEGICHG